MMHGHVQGWFRDREGKVTLTRRMILGGYVLDFQGAVAVLDHNDCMSLLWWLSGFLSGRSPSEIAWENRVDVDVMGSNEVTYLMIDTESVHHELLLVVKAKIGEPQIYRSGAIFGAHLGIILVEISEVLGMNLYSYADNLIMPVP